MKKESDEKPQEEHFTVNKKHLAEVSP